MFRFFLVSVAFTSAWVAVSSQLGYYRKLHGPAVLLQVGFRGWSKATCISQCLTGADVNRWSAEHRLLALHLTFQCPRPAYPAVRAPPPPLVQLNIAYFLPSIPLLIVSAFLDRPLEARLGVLRWCCQHAEDCKAHALARRGLHAGCTSVLGEGNGEWY